jgi:hypothetical protein
MPGMSLEHPLRQGKKTDWGINLGGAGSRAKLTALRRYCRRCYLRQRTRDSRAENDMTDRLRFVAACCLSLFWLSGPTDARAADPGFCRQFTKAAISQVRGALADPRCGAGIQGARWSTDFAVHYEWCLGASLDAAAAESKARTRFLRACTSR